MGALETYITDVDGVTAGDLRPELKAIGAPSRVGGVPLNDGAGDLAVTAGWGHAGQGGVTMPGKGKASTRPYASEELEDPKVRALGSCLRAPHRKEYWPETQWLTQEMSPQSSGPHAIPSYSEPRQVLVSFFSLLV